MKQLTFPIERTTCPECGCPDRIAGAVGDREKEKGKISKDLPACISIDQFAVLDPRSPGLTAPNLVIMRDICAKCLHEYIFKVDMKELPTTGPMPKGKPHWER